MLLDIEINREVRFRTKYKVLTDLARLIYKTGLDELIFPISQIMTPVSQNMWHEISDLTNK